jgi:hypothetical protein
VLIPVVRGCPIDSVKILIVILTRWEFTFLIGSRLDTMGSCVLANFPRDSWLFSWVCICKLVNVCPDPTALVKEDSRLIASYEFDHHFFTAGPIIGWSCGEPSFRWVGIWSWTTAIMSLFARNCRCGKLEYWMPAGRISDICLCLTWRLTALLCNHNQPLHSPPSQYATSLSSAPKSACYAFKIYRVW